MKYFIIAGEASGDLHASNLMRELKVVDPDAQFQFLGGDLMALQGGKPIIHYREMAFMGFINVIKNVGKIRRNMKICQQSIANFHPDVVILVDYPSFNLQIAKFVKKKLNLPVYYYISPKIWAWKEFRIKQIKKQVDKMFTILPFETDFYKKHDYEVTYVGNPSVDSVANRSNPDQTFQEFCRKNYFSDKPIIALLPGSRKQEISACLPKMLASVAKYEDFQIVISGAPGVEKEFYSKFLENQQASLVFDQTYDLLAHAQAAIVNSGTATLETALIGTPQVVVYEVPMGKIALMLKNVFIHVPYVSLVNLIAGHEVVKELIAHYFTIENIQKEMDLLLFDENYRKQMAENYESIRLKLGSPRAAKKAAESIFNSLVNSKR